MSGKPFPKDTLNKLNNDTGSVIASGYVAIPIYAGNKIIILGIEGYNYSACLLNDTDFEFYIPIENVGVDNVD